MTTQEAVRRFAARPHDEKCLWGTWAGLKIDVWAEAWTAAVRLIGWLDDCHTTEDLIAGVKHFEACVRIGLFSPAEWHAEAEAVAHELQAAGVYQQQVVAFGQFDLSRS